MTEIRMDSNDAFAVQAKQLIFLQKNGTLNDIKDMILPCITGTDMVLSDVLVNKWYSFNIYYVIDWNKRFPLIEAWDYIEESVLSKYQLSSEQIHDLALQNLSKQKVLYRKIFQRKDIICLKLDNRLVPPISNSILLMEHIWERLYKKLDGPFYVFPLYRDCIFAVSEKNVHSDWKNSEDIIQMIKNACPDNVIPFSEIPIFCNGRQLCFMS